LLAVAVAPLVAVCDEPDRPNDDNKVLVALVDVLPLVADDEPPPPP